ncbi:hemoglobin/transferrin/lactoferrin receptor protein [Fodinibius roseus]|uniref:Hemoglobin/transferrin/lactoferrin receptor protein n=1 Tax=Fodinibius roseus TaxID=1194090 RepID=A0A1M5GK76_9BACT|nr:TonB-dependent receptor [Fodinibius roseus]SHG03921.1 hemoglobin/transferrin/lactoferrin receptor protein [Fodinibius roseus]
MNHWLRHPPALFLPPLLLLLGLLYPPGSSAQTLKVVEETTREAIPQVYIYNNGKNKMTVTDAGGEASLEPFSESDTLNFQHPGFEPFAIRFSRLGERDYEVALTNRGTVMGEVYVSASKWEQALSDIPQKITQIGEEHLQFRNPQTAGDLLQSSGKVFLQKSQMGGGSPMIRGFAANSVLIAVDGVRMNNAIFRSGNLQNVLAVDPNALRSTEVLFGPGSIIYGSDALGGVMNFRTKRPSLSYSGDAPTVTAAGLTRYSSANHERTIHADAGIGYENWGTLTSVTYSHFDDLRSGDDFYDDFPDFGKRKAYVVRRQGEDVVVENDEVTRQRPSGYRQLNLMQKVRYRPGDRWDLSYGFHYAGTSDIPRYDRLIQREEGDRGPLVNAEWYYGPQIWMMNAVEADHLEGTTFYDKMSVVLSHQWFQESRNDRKFGEAELRNREENLDLFTANVDFDKRWGTTSELFYGLEGLYNDVRSRAASVHIETGARSPAPTRYPDEGSRYRQLAGYAKYQHDLTSDMTVVAGARYSHVLLDARFSGDFYDLPFGTIELETGAFSGSLGFTFRPLEELQLSLNGSTGFRAPNVDDAAKVFDSEPGTVVVPNEELRPEHAYNLDFTVINEIEERLRLELNAYYTWLEDAMVRRSVRFGGADSIRYDGTMSNVEALVNAGAAYVYGASLGFSAELNRTLGIRSELTYTHGRDRSGGEPLRHAAPLFGTAGISYETDKLRAEVYTEFNGPKKWDDLAPSERNKPHLYTPEGAPAWATLNIRTSYRFSGTFTVDVGLENVLDKHYRPYSSGISAPGRNLSVSLRGEL